MGEGLSIVAITYDAMEWCGATYGAIREDCVGVFAFMVGGNREGVTTGLEGLSDLNTFYFAKTVTTDGEEGIQTNEYLDYTITPTATNGQPLTVSVMNVSGYPTVTASPWETYAPNEDGSYTIKLRAGRNVLKVEAGDAMRCYVLHAVGSDVTIENVTNPGQAIGAGETVKVAYSGVMTPQPKLGAIYNPGFGGTAYLEGTLFDSEGEELMTVSGEGTQYGIAKNAGIKVIPPENGKFTVSNVRIHLGAYGSAPGTHLNLGLQSEGGDYSGEDSPEATNYWCLFQDVTLSVGESDYPAAAQVIKDLIDKIGQVEFTDVCKERIDAAREAYDSAVQMVQDLVSNYGTLTDAGTPTRRCLTQRLGRA